jgi:hypothetical protein
VEAPRARGLCQHLGVRALQQAESRSDVLHPSRAAGGALFLSGGSGPLPCLDCVVPCQSQVILIVWSHYHPDRVSSQCPALPLKGVRKGAVFLVGLSIAPLGSAKLWTPWNEAQGRA